VDYTLKSTLRDRFASDIGTICPLVFRILSTSNFFFRMLKTPLLVLLIVCLCSFQTSSTSGQVALSGNPLDPFPPNAAALVEKAKASPEIAAVIESFNTGNGIKLKENLQSAKAKDPTLPASDVMVARLFMAKGQWSEALTVLESHVAENPIDAEAHKNFAEIAMVSGRWSDAWLQLSRAYELIAGMKFSEARKSDFIAELIKLRGEVAEQRRDLDTATKQFESLAKMQPQSGDPIWALGRLKVTAGEVDAGAALLKKAKQLDPKLPQPDLAIALALLGTGEREKAEVWFRSGLVDKASASETNWLQYLQFLIDDGRSDAAKTLVLKAPPEYQAQRDFKLVKAVLHRYLGELPEAEKLLSELHQANPNDFDAADHLALVLVESSDEGKRARAEQISEANLRQAPTLERLAATAAWIKFKTGSADVADKILGQVVSGGRISPQTAYYSAMILTALGRQEEGQQFLKSAVEAPGDFPQKKSAKAQLIPVTPKN
jgi:tetratricopeptide (TPR) repeat protein